MSRRGPMKTSSRYQSPATLPGFRGALTVLPRSSGLVRRVPERTTGITRLFHEAFRIGRKKKVSSTGSSKRLSCYQSGRVDLNHRPPGAEPGALTGLRHAPKFRQNAQRAADKHRKFMVRLARPGVPRERAT